MALQKATSKPMAFWPDVRPKGMLSKATAILPDSPDTDADGAAGWALLPRCRIGVSLYADDATVSRSGYPCTAHCLLLAAHWRNARGLRAPEQRRRLVRDAVARAPVRA